MKHLGKIFILSFAVCLLIFPVMTRVASAQTTSTIVNVKFPCPSGLGLGNCQPSTDIPSYLNNLYKFAVGIAGALAVAMIVAGGVYYTVSAGSSDKQREAKSMITSAIWGLILLFGSYLILRTVNPQITNLGLGFTDIAGNPVQKLATTTSGGELVQTNNDCGDYASITAWGFKQPGPHCDTRKIITNEEIQIRSASNPYYDSSYTLPPKSVVWVYPYYITNAMTDKACLIYAYKEPELGGKYSSTTIVNLGSGLKLCAPQKQVASICKDWKLTYLSAASNKGPFTYQEVSVAVSDAFNYPDPTSPPPMVFRPNYPIPNVNICYSNFCKDATWSCTQAETTP